MSAFASHRPKYFLKRRWKLTCSSVGAATRTSRHRERIGAMILLVLLAHRMRRMLVMYFSIVRRSAACASRVSESASLMITTTYELRSPPKASLLTRQGRRLTLETLLCVQVHLLRLRNFLQNILYHHAVVHADIADR